MHVFTVKRTSEIITWKTHCTVIVTNFRSLTSCCGRKQGMFSHFTQIFIFHGSRFCPLRGCCQNRLLQWQLRGRWAEQKNPVNLSTLTFLICRQRSNQFRVQQRVLTWLHAEITHRCPYFYFWFKGGKLHLYLKKKAAYDEYILISPHNFIRLS